MFSDDITWAKEHLAHKPSIQFIDSVESDVREFELMKNCKHFIIANSTFSLWAAWLSPHRDKKVIMPRQWYRDTTMQSYHEVKQYFPTDWIKI